MPPRPGESRTAARQVPSNENDGERRSQPNPLPDVEACVLQIELERPGGFFSSSRREARALTG